MPYGGLPGPYGGHVPVPDNETPAADVEPRSAEDESIDHELADEQSSDGEG